MKYVRIGLCMITVIALIVPSPVAAQRDPFSVDTGTSRTRPIHVESEAETVSPRNENEVPTKSQPAPETQAVMSVQPQTLSPASGMPVPSSPSTKIKPNDSSAASPDVQKAPAAANTGRVLITKVRFAGEELEEFIELYNADDKPLQLAGWKLQVLKKDASTPNDNPRVIKTFGDVVLAPGEFYVLRNGPATDGFDETFDIKVKNSLTNDGSVRLVNAAGVQSDLIGWAKTRQFETAPAPAPDSSKPNAVLQRCVTNGAVVDNDNNQTDFAYYERYELRWFVACQEDPPVPRNACRGVSFSEIGANLEEPFIEVYNSANQAVDLTGCQITTNRSKKNYVFTKHELAPGGFLAIKLNDTSLNLVKSSGTVYLLTSTGDEIDAQPYEVTAKNTSWSLIDGEWKQTYVPTPGAANTYQKWPPCPAGKVRSEETGHCIGVARAESEPVPCQSWQYRNPETGRCKNYLKTADQKPCQEGQYRSEATGRCRSIASAAAKVLKPCRDDQFRNPATGRCKKIAADSEVVKECAEGFERNPATKRCRKIVQSNILSAGFGPEKVKHVAGAVWGWWVFGGVSFLALVYAGWQWRWEMKRLIARTATIVTGSKK